MKGFLAVAALAGVALAAPQPQASGSGCMSSVTGTFGLSVVNVTKSSKRELERRQVGNGQYTLQNGVFKDSQGRTGEIVANRQFQFDNPTQAGAVYTSGWSVCSNGSIAVMGNAVFYQCLSGTFYNLYDRSQGGQCSAVYIVATGMGAPAAGPSGSASQVTDGQVQATTAKSSAKVSQISDGQVQATTKATAGGVSQISDGQVQAPTSKPQVSQISDGQVQVTTAKPPMTTGAGVSQISDGQVQAPKTTAAPSMMTTSRGISQISDGQVQAPTSTKPVVATFTGAAARVGGSFAFVAGVVGAVAML